MVLCWSQEREDRPTPAQILEAAEHGAKEHSEGCLNFPGYWYYFYSHTQRNKTGVALVERLSTQMKDEGRPGWMDVKMPKRSEAAMREGVENSKCVIACITGPCVDPEKPEVPEIENAYFGRSYCLAELEWAIEAGVPIQPVIDSGDKHKIGDLLGLCPEFTKSGKPFRNYLGSVDWIDLNRSDSEYWEVGARKVMRQSDDLIKIAGR